MKKYLAIGLVVCTSMMPVSVFAKSKNSCSGLYAGKPVSISYVAKVGDFWLGYRTTHESASGVIVGVGNGRASVRIEGLSWDVQHQPTVPKIGSVYEYECNNLNHENRL